MCPWTRAVDVEEERAHPSPASSSRRTGASLGLVELEEGARSSIFSISGRRRARPWSPRVRAGGRCPSTPASARTTRAGTSPSSIPRGGARAPRPRRDKRDARPAGQPLHALPCFVHVKQVRKVWQSTVIQAKCGEHPKTGIPPSEVRGPGGHTDPLLGLVRGLGACPRATATRASSGAAILPRDKDGAGFRASSAG